MAKLIVNTERKGAKINRNLYGHFSEHLGRCIYNGLFVGKDSPIPNVNGMRTDVVEALRHIRVPVLRWPGACAAAVCSRSWEKATIWKVFAATARGFRRRRERPTTNMRRVCPPARIVRSL